MDYFKLFPLCQAEKLEQHSTLPQTSGLRNLSISFHLVPDFIHVKLEMFNVGATSSFRLIQINRPATHVTMYWSLANVFDFRFSFEL